MPLDTLIFDSSECKFPGPRLPLLPSGFGWIVNRHTAAEPHSLPGIARSFSRGRYALHQAYRQAGLDAGSVLLAPAYHCRTMLDPALALDAHIVLYPLHADLSIDLAALEELARHSTLPIRAMLATHYFGFPKELSQVAEWCQSHRIALIEDCSHTLVTERNCPKGIGLHGDYIVSSPYKFFSSPDGGLLWSRHQQTATTITPRNPSWFAEFRALKHTYEAARRNDRARPEIERLPDELSPLLAQPANCAKELCRPEGPSSAYAPQNEGVAALRLSRIIHHRTGMADITQRRRNNYQFLCKELSNIPHCRPFFPDLPEHCTPYMLPLYIDMPNPHFFYLKGIGVPIWRWDSMATSGCRIANDYRLRLLHLPCHQSLQRAQLEWMIEAVRLVMTSPAPVASA